MRERVFIGVGSNLGDRLANINKALALLRNDKRIKIIKISSFIETDPQEYKLQPKYLNGVVEIETELSPHNLLEVLHSIEAQLGRERKIRFGPRTIDLDILLYGDKIINEENLKVPHPRMFERSFVLIPLREIAPELKDKIVQWKKIVKSLSLK